MKIHRTWKKKHCFPLIYHIYLCTLSTFYFRRNPEKLSLVNTVQGSKLAVVRWSRTTKKSNRPAKYKFQWSARPVTFNFSLFPFF